MAETSIEWTSGPNGEPGYTFNPVEGCEKVSPGCKNCYAETLNKRWRHGQNWGPNSRRLQRSESYWRTPLKWNLEAKAAGKRFKVFCASVADVFEDHPDWVEPRQRLFELIDQTQHLDWLLLTKRPENIQRLIPAASWSFKPPAAWPNVWLGTTVEDQSAAEKRLRHLLAVPAAVHFVSAEPLLEKLSLGPWLQCRKCGGTGDYEENHGNGAVERLACPWCLGGDQPFVKWVICGGESGHGARPFDIEWARALRDECAALHVAFFMKQLGRRTRMRPSEVGGDAELEPMVLPMRPKEIGVPQRPHDLWVRQWPEARHV